MTALIIVLASAASFYAGATHGIRLEQKATAEILKLKQEANLALAAITARVKKFL